MSPPNPNPSEKKICVPASNQTTGSSSNSQRGVNKWAIPSEAPKIEINYEKGSLIKSIKDFLIK